MRIIQLISNKQLQELLPMSLTSTPGVSIQKNNQVWCGAAMLIHYLESFTDSLVVVDKNTPIGIIGGKEIIVGLAKEPSSKLFDDTSIEDILSQEISQISEDTTLQTLIEKWKQAGRAFSVIPNQYGGLSAISARSILEIGIRCKTSMTISDIQKKNVVKFSPDDKIGTIIKLMLENKTRRLLLENSTKFISDRIIIEKIARDLDYLRKTDNFLDLPVSSFKLESAKVVEEDMPLPNVYDRMFGMLHPYIIYKDQVISPWDLCVTLLSDKLSLD